MYKRQLFYDDYIIETPKLTIPHKHLHKREFALKPIEEIVPDFIHPALGKTIKQLAEKCNDIESKAKLYRPDKCFKPTSI